MRSIVVPVNFTENSACAARYAADMAAAIRADLHLIYVFQPPVSAAEIPLPESVYDEMRDSGIELLDDLSKELRRRTADTVKVYTDMEIGGVGPRLEAFCKFRNPFLVVMGSSGHGVENILQGSHTVQAMRHLHYPLLVVPPKTHWTPVQKIVVACDKEDIDGGMPGTLPFLDELSQLLGARLEVVHVITNGEASPSEAIAEYNVWKKDVKALVPELHFVRQSKVQSGVSEYLENHKADWLMVFPKSHSFLEFHKSRARQIVLSCAIPVMSVHE
ncbi:MAG TPA: universal stress protein [Puia sp.]|jgi:nucleotide-binding universal stress UspA family protein|nr:universal stress protein [Puia sp.]